MLCQIRIFVVSVYYFELYHIPLLLLLLFAKCLIYKRVAEELSPRYDNISLRYDEDGEEEKDLPTPTKQTHNSSTKSKDKEVCYS
ncbi:hypothetical protein NECAME_05963 [Necator americanus]|uniref:Uncharacterized protein n=1 Tax=Necator americanus TaxID=51031 RepID=W2TZH8_NECAM|nr:hypothetical protein NECAME_05963 [Necator americanus]ETN86471.1 hypothetical protein NECAME_05963 [Necator americanus]